MNALLDKSRVEIKIGDYGVAQATALGDADLLPQVREYRRLTSSRMIPLEPSDVEKRLTKATYHVSRKIDGEFTVLVFRDGQCLSLNPGGTVRTGLPWQAEAASLLSKQGIKNALVAGELYVDVADRRPRVHDVTSVARQPQSAADLQRLRFAVFDLVIVNEDVNEKPYAEKWALIEKLFANGERVHPVETKVVKDVEGIRKLFRQWVEEAGDEGIIVRSETADLFKIKPRHNLDAVVVGFTESVDERKGLLHDLLVAVKRKDDTLQILTRVGGGFTDDERRNMLSDLKDMVVESKYAEVNSDHVAYQMVRPEWVVEISCLDLISETTRGGTVNRMVLNFVGNNGHSHYEPVRRLPLVSVISPQFVRQRDDKTPQREDVRIEQVSQRVEVPLVDRDARQMTLAKSQLLRRDVYTKTAKGETMVRKFVTWKTNKETEGDEFPAYVLHYTDYSPNRKDPLDREVRVSSSYEQIQTLLQEFIAENVKKGWDLHSSQTFANDAVPTAVPPSSIIESPAPTPAKAESPVREMALATATVAETGAELISADATAASEPSTGKKRAAKKTAAPKSAETESATSAAPRKRASKKKAE